MVLFAFFAAAFAADPAGAGGSPAGADACAAPAPIVAVEAALAGAEAAWGVDEEGFARGAASVRAAVRCAAAPLPTAVAARVHRVEGLAAFLVRDAERARAAFAGARAADPAYQFPTEMVPAQNPVRVAYDGATPGTETRLAPAPARTVALYVDGAATRAVPTGRAAIVQVKAGEIVTASRWVMPGEPLPDYRVRGAGTRVPTLIATGVLAAGTGALWALAADARTNVREAPTYAQAVDLQGDANTLGTATVVAGAATLATGVGAFVFARW